MGISRFGSRLSVLILAFLIAATIAASAAAQTAPLGDVYSSGSGANSGGGEFRGVIISITPMGINRVDVKLQNPANGDIHSVTVEADVAQGLTAGQRVTQYKDPETGETMLAPTLLQKPGESVPGQAQDTGNGPSPVEGGNNGGAPTNPGGVTGGGGVPPYPGGVTGGGGVPPYTGGITGGAPSYPAPQMVGTLTGSGVVNGIPVDIGGSGPNTIPVPASAKPGTPITASNRTGQGNWKGFRGTLQTDGSGYYVQFDQGYYQGNYNGRYQQGWFRIQPQRVPLHAG